jgi:hypothetical protein
MKNALYILALFLCMASFTLLSLAQMNYELAISAARHSEGSDLAIEQALKPYGFTGDIWQDITTTDKINALFTN